jgi:hypothetical protein
LLSAPAPFDAVEADEIDSSMHDKAPQRWNKYPDAPLGNVISKKQRLRATPKADRARTIVAKPSAP